MSSDSTPARWNFSLRGNEKDRAIVQRVIDAHARMGLTISMNQAVLVLIRRSATPDADTQEEAWRGIEHHWADCPFGCDVDHIKCPEGWRLRDAFHRVVPNPRRRPLGTGPSPTPPPPLPEQPTAEVVQLPAWRRYFGVGKKAS